MRVCFSTPVASDDIFLSLYSLCLLCCLYPQALDYVEPVDLPHRSPAGHGVLWRYSMYACAKNGRAMWRDQDEGIPCQRNAGGNHLPKSS